MIITFTPIDQLLLCFSSHLIEYRETEQQSVNLSVDVVCPYGIRNAYASEIALSLCNRYVLFSKLLSLPTLFVQFFRFLGTTIRGSLAFIEPFADRGEAG